MIFLEFYVVLLFFASFNFFPGRVGDDTLKNYRQTGDNCFEKKKTINHSAVSEQNINMYFQIHIK